MIYRTSTENDKHQQYPHEYQGVNHHRYELPKNNLNIIGCENTVFTGQNYENFFKITGNNITVKGITFTEGYGGITVNKDASLKIMDSKFIENSGINGICIDNHGNLTVISSYFSNNTAIRDAGCISSLERSHTTIINSTFEFNSAGRNGGALKIMILMQIFSIAVLLITQLQVMIIMAELFITGQE